jgi:hypothetical protein
MTLNLAMLAFCLGIAVAAGTIVVGITMIEPEVPPETWMSHHG